MTYIVIYANSSSSTNIETLTTKLKVIYIIRIVIPFIVDVIVFNIFALNHIRDLVVTYIDEVIYI